MKKFVGLARISSKKQLAKGNSLEDQTNSILEYAKKLNGEVVEIIKIQVSGSKMKLNSSVLSKVLLRAKDANTEVILSKLDRLSRDELSLHQIKAVAKEIGTQIHLAGLGKTIQEMSDMEFSMLAMFAQHELTNLKSRIRESSKKSEGTFGRIVDAKEASKASILKRRTLAREWEEQSGILDEIKQAKALLRKPTLESVCFFLNGKGLVTRTGKRFKTGNLQQQIIRLGFNNLKCV